MKGNIMNVNSAIKMMKNQADQMESDTRKMNRYRRRRKISNIVTVASFITGAVVASVVTLKCLQNSESQKDSND